MAGQFIGNKNQGLGMVAGYGRWLARGFGGLGERGPASGQGRWAYHPPPWRRWLGVVAFVAVMAGMTMGAKSWAQLASAPFVFEGEMLRIETPGWESSGDYLVDASAYIDVAQGIDAHISGNIGAVYGSRNGLYKLGGGMLRLSGANSYLGSTRLLQGGLHVDGPQVFGMWGGIEALRGTVLEYSAGVEVARPLALSPLEIADYMAPGRYTDVAPPADLEQAVGWKVSSGRAAHSGLLQGSAPFVKLGQGLLDITGDAMAYTGSARVAQGALAINEIFSGSVNVGAGARLQGTVSVGAVHVEPGGVLAPGDGSMPGTGTLRVAGDVGFDPGSRFELRALATGESDSLWAGGKALLDGQVAVLAHNGLWQASTTYEILSAQGGLEGSEFASVTTDLAFLTPSLSYGDSTVTLALARNDLPIEEVGETPDEEEVGRVIDEEVPPGPDTPPSVVEPEAPELPKANPDLNGGMAGQDKDSARLALQQLTGSWNASVLASVWDDSRFMREAVLRRSMSVSRVRGSASTPASYATPLTPWVEAFDSDQVRDGKNGISGDTRRLHGFMLGVAAAVNASWHAGAFLGAQRSRLERVQGLAHADIDTTHAGLHLAGAVAGVRMALGAARSWHRLKTSRFINAGTLRDALGARYRGKTTQVFGEAEWPLFERVWLPTKKNGTAGGLTKARGAMGEPTKTSGLMAGLTKAGGVNAGSTRRAAAEQGFVPKGLYRISVAPFARLAWARSELDGFIETGGPAALNVRPASTAAWLTTLGIRVEAGVHSFPFTAADSSPGASSGSSAGPGTGSSAGSARKPGGTGSGAKVYAQLAWHYAGRGRAESTQSFRDSATQTLFTSQGLAPERRSWSLQLGLDVDVGRAGNVGFAYLGRYGSGLRDQGIGGWARIAF